MGSIGGAADPVRLPERTALPEAAARWTGHDLAFC
jgi:hypothetical protein